MRYVDLESVLADPRCSALILAAEGRGGKIAEATDPSVRKTLVDSSGSFWKGFRELFEALDTGIKCWYTESENPGADADIDHYRPKASVRERPDHTGYWWEALNWRNFRFSCQRANRARKNPEEGQTLGKQDYFPVLVEANRWMNPADPCIEEPALLDPTVPGDPEMLSFSADGTVALAERCRGDEVAAERFRVSRLYLHLDWAAFVEQRLNIYREVSDRVREGDDVAEDALEGVPSAVRTISNVSIALIKMTSPRAPYSAAAIAYIHMFRDKPWIEDYVLPNIRPIGPQ